MNARIKKTFTLQQDHSDCGVACLLSIIQYHDGEASLENLRRLSGTSIQGTTLLGLIQAAQHMGLDAEGLQADSIFDLNELHEPSILHVIIEERYEHYLVYYPRSSDESLSFRYTLGDPAKGIIEMSSEELEIIWKSKALVSIKPNQHFQEKKNINRKKLQWVVGLINEDIAILIFSMILGIGIAILGISTAIFSQKLIDDILPNGNTPKLIASLVLVIVLLIVKSSLGYLRSFFLIKQGLHFNNRMIRSFYGNILRLPKTFFDSRKTGEIIARLGDTRRIQTVIISLAGNVAIDLLAVLVSFVFVFTYSNTIGVLALAFIPVYWFALFKFSKSITRGQKTVMSNYAYAESNFIDTVQGVSEIKLTGNEAFFEQQNTSVFGKFQKSIADLSLLGIRFGLISDIIGIVFAMTMIGTAALMVLDKQLKVGEMVALLSIAGNIMPLLNKLVSANIQIQEAKVAFDRMFEFTSMEKEFDSQITEEIQLTDIHILNLAFRFPGRNPILKDISLIIKRGEILALLGESGEGKSTIIQLLQKFYLPESGKIIVNNIDLCQLGTSAWRKTIGSVPQDLKIFNGNLLYNIALSEDAQEFQKVVSFCEKKGFSKYFNEFPQGFMSLLGEEGINISGGQKQLVILARALYRAPKFLLLDEPTSAMDRNTENFVLELLEREKDFMAILMVTHRLKTAQRCDRIAVLEKGVISVCDTPNELLKSNNFFSTFYLENVTLT